MYILRSIIKWGWCPILITVVAVVSNIYGWSIEVVAPVVIVLLIIGLVVAVIGAREKQLELSALRLRQLAGHFYRRFMGSSSLSIFPIIESLFKVDEPKLWDWARACDMAERIFDTWCSSFISRVESDIRTRKFNVYLRTYLNELWLVNSHYFEFIEQFYELAERVEVPRETIDQYNRFVMEYNAFAQDFRDNISDLRKAAKTEIESPSVKFAKELSVVR
ncbi:MAG: hypothetical protein ACETVS_03335 [Dehalococcoidales bacterium]